MATIKLKNSTSSGNVPASLSQGEVAINVADGVWYYGGASAVQQNFKFGSVTVTGNTSLDGKLVVTGNTVMNGTLSATTSLNVGNGNGTISAATVTGTILKGILGSDASPVTAYINNGEIDGVTLGGESAVTIARATYIDIVNDAADNEALSVQGAEEQAVNYFEVKNSEGDIQFSIASNGRAVTNAVDIGGGAIDGTPIGTSSRSSGKFTTMDVNSTLVVTGNTVLNGTLSATTSLKVGNGDGSISGATITSSGDMTAGGDVYTDVLRRQSDSSTTTKIKLDDETVKTFGGSSSVWTTKVESQKFLVGQAGAGVISASTIHAKHTLSAGTDLYVDGTANLDAVDIDGNTQADGTITVGVDDTGYDVKFFGATSGRFLLWDQANDRLKYRDNVKAVFGTGNDLEIYHDSNNSYIDDTGTGTLFYRSGTQTFQNAAGSKTMATFNAASTVDLAFNNNVKLSTNNSGVHIDGTVSANTAVYAGTGVDDGVISAGTVNGAYQFITFVGNSGALDSDNWQYPGTNGISNHTWGYEADGSGTSTGSSTISISRTKQMSGIVLPAGTRVIGIVGALRSSVDDTAYAGLFTYSPDYGGPDTVNATLRLLAQSVDDSGGSSVLNDPQLFKADAAFASQYVVQEGDQLLPAFRRGPGGSTQTVIGTFTIIVKY